MYGNYEKHYLKKNVNSRIKQTWIQISLSLLSGCVSLVQKNSELQFLLIKRDNNVQILLVFLHLIMSSFILHSWRTFSWVIENSQLKVPFSLYLENMSFSFQSLWFLNINLLSCIFFFFLESKVLFSLVA